LPLLLHREAREKEKRGRERLLIFTSAPSKRNGAYITRKGRGERKEGGERGKEEGGKPTRENNPAWCF